MFHIILSASPPGHEKLNHERLIHERVHDREDQMRNGSFTSGERAFFAGHDERVRERLVRERERARSLQTNEPF